jgi:hypothetical protein
MTKLNVIISFNHSKIIRRPFHREVIASDRESINIVSKSNSEREQKLVSVQSPSMNSNSMHVSISKPKLQESKLRSFQFFAIAMTSYLFGLPILWPLVFDPNRRTPSNKSVVNQRCAVALRVSHLNQEIFCEWSYSTSKSNECYSEPYHWTKTTMPSAIQ